jgi:ubiquitin-like protein Pup
MAQIKRTEPTSRTPTERSGPASSPRVAATESRLKEGIDRLIDEIDDVLEENAETFVKEYVQRGGE